MQNINGASSLNLENIPTVKFYNNENKKILPVFLRLGHPLKPRCRLAKRYCYFAS